MTRAARSTLLLAAVAMLAACSGDDDTTPSTTTQPEVATSAVTPSMEATAPPTSSTPTSSTAPVTTPNPPTTTATTVTPTTVAPPSVQATAAPALNTSVPGTEEDQALAVIEGAYRVWIECLESIAACDTSTFNAYVTHPQLGGDQETIAEYKANNYEVDNARSLTYEVLEVDLEFTIPYAVVCERDQSTVVQRVAGQPDRVIEENDVEQVREIHLVETPLGWRVEGFATREDESCG